MHYSDARRFPMPGLSPPVIRLALVIPTLDRSGAEKQLTLLATHLPRDQFEVQVIALTRGGPFAADLAAAGVPLTILNKRWRFDPLAALRLRRTLRELRPDVVHSWLFAANSYVRLVLGRQHRSRPAVVISERCVDSWKSGWQLRLDRRLAPRTDRLIGNSRAVVEFYQALGYRPEQSQVIYNAVEPPPPPDFTREDLLRQLQLPPDARLVASVGRLAPQKRVGDLLWACQLLRQADPRARLLVIGDGPERERLLHYARQIEVAEYVRFLGARDDAARLVHLADVFWIGSDFEGLSNSLMEAMACGKPVVVSDIPPNRELVTHAVEGYIVPAGDGVAFTQFTRRLFDDESLARRMGEAGRARMTRDFGLDRMIESHVQLYRSLVEGRSRC